MTTMTDGDVATLFEQLDVLRGGHFRLSSGKHSDTYLQCALALSDPAVAERLGAALAQRLDAAQIDVVVSPALGGVLAGFVVAAALRRPFLFTERAADRSMTMRRGQHVQAGQRVLVVEDVVTTGGSAMEVVALVEAVGATVVGIASLVDRSAGLPEDQRPPLTPTALLPVTAQAWDPDDCPACAAGTPLDTPGSRHAA
jgi:orotate phosphoribosyltransferase